MTNQYVTTRVNYCEILKALETISRQTWERWGKQNSRSYAAWEVADYKTIGFTVGRQCGATNGIHQWIKQHPGQCLLITKDIKLRDASMQLYTEHHGDPSDYFRAVPTITQGANYRFHGYEGNEVPDDLKERVRYVILDDSVYHYTFGRSGGRKAFNEWVAENFHHDTFVILIK